MENFEDFEKKSYQEAKANDYSFTYLLIYFSKMALFMFKLFFLVAQELFQNIINSSQKKNIHGQLALVTGE